MKTTMRWLRCGRVNALQLPQLKIGRWCGLFGLLAISAAMIVGCDQRSTDAPPTYSLGSKPSAAVALDYVQRSTEVTLSALKRTPFKADSAVDMSRRAQEIYPRDKQLLDEWQKAGITLFVAAGSDKFSVCLDALSTGQKAWATAYPLNGPPDQRSLDERSEMLKSYSSLLNDCTAQIKQHLS